MLNLLSLVDFTFCAICSEGKDEPADFGSRIKYKIEIINFYSYEDGVNGDLLTESDFKNIELGIKNCSLSKSLKRISVLSFGIEESTLRSIMDEIWAVSV